MYYYMDSRMESHSVCPRILICGVSDTKAGIRRMKDYGDEQFINLLRKRQENSRNTDIRKGSVWRCGEELLFAEREIMKKRLWIWLPKNFSILSKELALIKYPDNNCPDIIYTDPATTVIVSFTQLELKAGEEQKACASIEWQIRETYGDTSVRGTETLHAGEMEIPCLISVTPALDAMVYNRMFFLPLDGKVCLGVCNCLEQDDWKELFVQMVTFVRVGSR